MKKIYYIIFLLLLMQKLFSANFYNVKVAKDGSGDYTSIQQAIHAAPSNGSTPFIIYITNGRYEEKLYLEKSFITLVGEDRDSTIINCSELRSIWRQTNADDWGAATVNIASSVTDITLANLTVSNNFAETHPEYPTKNDHTFAIRGGGHRVIIVNCNIVSTGGDTLSLWNTAGGMFYHNDCYFEGYVDYVCPRGYCYITNSRFFGHNTNASIWHDGSGAEDHKFVIVNSEFNGVKNFGLGRHHKEAAFYMFNCHFSVNVNDNGGIQFVGTTPLVWGSRIYYNNCHRQGGDLLWHKNNLKDSLLLKSISNPTWVFKNQWDPETKLGNLLSCAFLPSPENNSLNIGSDTALSWLAGRDSKSHLLYFGKTEKPDFIAKLNTATYELENLEDNTTYFWKVDEINETDTIKGKIWKFTTRDTRLPDKAYSPTPPDSAGDVSSRLMLKWKNEISLTDSIFLYFDTLTPPVFYKTMPLASNHMLLFDSLVQGKKYYWQVVAQNSNGKTIGDIWHFRVNGAPTSINDIKKAFQVFYQSDSQQIIVNYTAKTPGNFKVKIIDLQGKLLKEQIFSNPEGSSQFHISIADIVAKTSTSVLVCEIQNYSFIEKTKVIIN